MSALSGHYLKGVAGGGGVVGIAAGIARDEE